MSLELTLIPLAYFLLSSAAAVSVREELRKKNEIKELERAEAKLKILEMEKEQISAVQKSAEGLSPGMQKKSILEGDMVRTAFSDAELLEYTIAAAGGTILFSDSSCVKASFREGVLTFVREEEGGLFEVSMEDVRSIEGLVCTIEEIEANYGNNLQSFIYDRLMDRIPENMTVENQQMMEDDSILITLRVN